MCDFGKPQKALHLHIEETKARPKHKGHLYAVMEKYDGWFMYIDCINGEWQGIRSKTGRILPSMSKYSKLFNELDYPKANCRIIFEALIPDSGTETGFMEFKDCNGRFNQKKEVLQNVVLMVHDVLLEGKQSSFSRRYGIASVFLDRWAKSDTDWLQLAPILEVSRSDYDWYKHYNEIVARGGEGVILKNMAGLYEPDKRNFNLMKIKCDLTLDLEVVGIEEGEGKYAGTLGRLVVKSKDGIINKVSGMSDEQRHAWWNNPDLILHKVVEVQAMKVLSNGSLREGRFKAVRHDKTIEDIDYILTDIKRN